MVEDQTGVNATAATAVNDTAPAAESASVSGDDLFVLLDALRSDGFPIGIKEYISAQEVAAACTDENGIDPDRLRNWLAPVLCTNPDEQRLFYQRFAGWWAQQQPQPEPEPDPSDLKTELDADVRKARPWKWVALVIGLMAFAVVVLPRLLAPPPEPPPVVIEPDSSSLPQPPVEPTPVPEPEKILGPQLALSGSVTNREGQGIDGATIAVVKMLGTPYESAGPVTFSPDGMRALTISPDGTSVRLWDVASGRETVQLAYEGRGGGITSAGFSPDGTRVLTRSWDQIVRIFDAASGREIVALENNSDVTRASFSPDGTRVLTVAGTIVRIRNAASGRETAQFVHARDVSAAVFSPDGSRVLTVAQDMGAFVWGGLNSAVFSPNGARVLTTADATLRTWDATSGRELAQTELIGKIGSAGSVVTGIQSTGVWENTTRIWDVASGRELVRLVHDDEFASASFSPDSTRVLTASWDKTVRVWELESGREVARLMHGNDIGSAVFSPDGARVLTASSQGYARVWDVVSGREVARPAYSILVENAAFSPDGSMIAAGGPGGAMLSHWAISEPEGDFALASALAGGTALNISHPAFQSPPPHDLPAGFGALTIDAQLVPRPAQWLFLLIDNRDLARMIFAVLPLLAVVGWLLWRRNRRQLILERRAVRQVDDVAGVAIPEPRHNLYRDEAFIRARIEARRHQASGQGDLDADATVAETVRQLGWFTPVYKTRLRLPAYLALIDRSGFRDQQARLIDEFLDRLVEGGVTVDRYYFDRDPRLCATSVRGDTTQRAVRELAGRYPEHRLVLFSDGSGLLDPVTGRLASWTELFAAWPERALLTPVPTVHWSSREIELARQGCVVLPATPAGLLAFTDRLDSPDTAALPTSGDWRAPYPELIAAHPARWLQRQEPGRDEADELLQQVRRYLGDDSYRWLCALAVYPELDWYLTLYLGLQLKRSNGLPALDETALLALVRLPWLRRAVIPDWLRLRLIAELSRDDEETVRGFLRELLRARLEAPGSRFNLDIARPPAAMQRRGWTRFFTDLLRTEPDDSPLQDRVFVGFLLGKRPQRLQLLAPRDWQRWVYERGLSALGLRERAGMLLAAMVSVLLAVGTGTLIDSAEAMLVATSGSQITQRDWQPADAQTAEPQTSIQAIFSEQKRFQVRKLDLNGSGSRLSTPTGGKIKATLEINHNCTTCGTAINQIIVGLAGEDRAQACVWNGGQSSRGWQTVSFELTIPEAPGTYDIRTRYAQAYNCKDALGWWKVDRPEGPGPQSTIGQVVVEGVSQQTESDFNLNVQQTNITRQDANVEQNNAQQAEQKSQSDGRGIGLALDEKWAATVYALYQQTIQGRYPFERASKRDVSLADFSRFFGDDGLLQTFIERELKPYLDRSGSDWRWRGDAQGLSRAVLAELQRAERIRTAFFLESGRQPMLRFSLKPARLDNKVSGFSLDIGGQQLNYRHGPTFVTDFQWPPESEKLFSARYRFNGLKSGTAEVVEEGPWAWLRLLDRARISPTRGQDISNIEFTSDGVDAVFELRISGSVNPFSSDLRNFRLPQRLLNVPPPPTIINMK